MEAKMTDEDFAQSIAPNMRPEKALNVSLSACFKQAPGCRRFRAVLLPEEVCEMI